MRQGQQHRRGGGRGRKPQNPLARNYESNGPDVKIRGTAAYIAEKYMSLARDALASGDVVAAESYFQHAEHYNRIIMATRIQSGGDGGDIRDRRDGGRNMPGLASEQLASEAWHISTAIPAVTDVTAITTTLDPGCHDDAIVVLGMLEIALSSDHVA